MAMTHNMACQDRRDTKPPEAFNPYLHRAGGMGEAGDEEWEEKFNPDDEATWMKPEGGFGDAELRALARSWK